MSYNSACYKQNRKERCFPVLSRAWDELNLRPSDSVLRCPFPFSPFQTKEKPKLTDRPFDPRFPRLPWGPLIP